ncbi:unnamed protein product [Kuraishia capsulata CBS 1993]|uniref:Transcriptional regulatory protein SDS3 n=1 Tax=Kuraishia capsulata CBS 1993 TaxID=1382522 RepID=W6MQZ5_9ASCO|nr:uncharacterized protein KUCA_T00005098001 [Kuraishia capsulata CBS 1993]CDK29111.1 unnamed protein product [Kuraishia capsulata CBS 1993]
MALSKKDKRRQQISSKLQKMDEQFLTNKDYYYRRSLNHSQKRLSTLHSEENEEFLGKVVDFEEDRDHELVRLRLWEEYQVGCVTRSFKEDYEKSKEDYDKVIKMIKEKLYERIQKKIKQLKEDKALMDIASNSVSPSRYHFNGTSAYDSADGQNSSSFFNAERRTRRKRNDGMVGANSGGDESNDSATGGGATSATGARGSGVGGRSRKVASHGAGSGSSRNNSSGDEAFYFTDNQSLNQLLYGADYDPKREKPTTRHSTKSFAGVPGLKVEEVNEDLAVLRNATANMSQNRIAR